LRVARPDRGFLRMCICTALYFSAEVGAAKGGRSAALLHGVYACTYTTEAALPHSTLRSAHARTD
jgi:hypothetical protein